MVLWSEIQTKIEQIQQKRAAIIQLNADLNILTGELQLLRANWINEKKTIEAAEIAASLGDQNGS